MTTPVPKGKWPAVTDIEFVANTRLRLYEFYDRDEPLRDALIHFHDEWWNKLGRQLRRLDDCLPDLKDAEQRLADLVGLEVAREYLGGLVAICTAAGLDRFSMVGTPPVVLVGYLPSGIAQAHRYLWHLDKALLWERSPIGDKSSGSAVHRPTFVSLASGGTPILAVDTSIAGTAARWNPRKRRLATARRQLPESTDLDRKTIGLELARIGREGGYHFPNDSPKLDRDAQWVWWRIHQRWTYEQITRAWMRLHPGDIRLQRRQTDQMARKWDAENPLEAGSLTAPKEAIAQVRKAISTFARRARVNVKTGPGRRPSQG